MQCYGYVVRDSDGRYSAELPDFPECIPHADQLDGLQAAVNAAIADCLRDRQTPIPAPRTPEMLGRSEDGDLQDGFWMAFDISAALEGFSPGVGW